MLIYMFLWFESDMSLDSLSFFGLQLLRLLWEAMGPLGSETLLIELGWVARAGLSHRLCFTVHSDMRSR